MGLDPDAGAYFAPPVHLGEARREACARLAAAPDMDDLWCGDVQQRLAAAAPALHEDLERDGALRDLVFRLFLGLPSQDSEDPDAVGVHGWNFVPREMDVATGRL